MTTEKKEEINDLLTHIFGMDKGVSIWTFEAKIKEKYPTTSYKKMLQRLVDLKAVKTHSSGYIVFFEGYLS